MASLVGNWRDERDYLSLNFSPKAPENELILKEELQFGLKKACMKSLLFIFSFVIVLSQSCKEPAKKETLVKTFGKITAGGFDVYYEIQGSGEPILFLHAGFQDHNMWDDQANKLAEQFTVITLHQPFHGNTLGHDTSTLVADLVRAVLDTLRIQKTSVVGLSMGAATATDFMIAYPDRVNKAILISSG